MKIDAEPFQGVGEIIDRHVTRAQHQGIDLVDDHRLGAALMLQVNAVRIAAMEAHVGEHLHSEFVQRCRGLIADIERQGLSGGNPVDGTVLPDCARCSAMPMPIQSARQSTITTD